MTKNPTNTVPSEGHSLIRPDGALSYWHSLIDEAGAAQFLKFSIRSMQGMRYRGGGPRYIRMSSRCIRYRRSDLRAWAEQRLRTSTSDRGQEPARHEADDSGRAAA